MVYEKDAVQVVNFVLEYLRHQPAGTTLEPFPLERASTNGDAFMALGRTIDAADREAPLIHFRALARSLYYLRVDIDFMYRRGQWGRHPFLERRRRYGAVFTDYEDAIGDIDLRRSKRHSLEFGFKRFFHIVDDARKSRRPEHLFRDGLCCIAKYWGTILHNLYHCSVI